MGFARNLHSIECRRHKLLYSFRYCCFRHSCLCSDVEKIRSGEVTASILQVHKRDKIGATRLYHNKDH